MSGPTTRDEKPYAALPDLRQLSTYDRTKEISYHPYFLGGISRWIWRFYMYRLTGPGRWLACLTVVFVVLGAASIDLPIFEPFVYAFSLWLVATGIAFLLPPRAKLEYAVPARVGVNSEAPIRVQITCTGKTSIVEGTVIPMRLPPYIDCIPPTGIPVRELKRGEQLVGYVSLICRKRGNYTLKGFRVESAFPIGLLHGYTDCWHTSNLLVYPTFQELTSMDLPIGSRYQPGGVALASKLGESLEYIGNREYREGDNIRDIDWKATARLTRPITREYREEYFHRVGVIQDTYVPKGRRDRDEDFERSISICAAVSDYMAREEYIVDLFAAGPNLYHLTAGRSLAFQDQILDILACIEPAVAEPFQIVEPELLEDLSKLTTVICVMLDWNETRRDFVERVRQVCSVKVIIVRSAPCTLDPSSESASLSLRLIDQQKFDNGVGEL
jgi:uncharacterized protein (DUF58 family)